MHLDDLLLRPQGFAMSQSYTEFAPVHHDDAEDNRNLFSALPREFQVMQESRVPLLQIQSEDQERDELDSSFLDFIILAEFSELEGPIPLATIPECVKSPLSLNNFTVHLMSTDYQVNSVGKFKISEDTQVLRKNVFKNVHVFMQYFTLYDIKARGFVRPFCFGYVSKDHVKLDHKLDMLISEFDKMTKVLKQANRTWFGGELVQYLDKLRAAKDTFIQRRTVKCEGQPGADDMFTFDPNVINNSSEDEDDPDAITLEQIANQYMEIQSILDTVKSFENPSLNSQLNKLSSFLDVHLPSHPTFVNLLSKLGISVAPNSVQRSISAINIPLVHPLKAKGESLRPLTTLGQVGIVHLLWKLVVLHSIHRKDLIFAIMRELGDDFEQHCGHLREERRRKRGHNNSSSSSSNGDSPKKGTEAREEDGNEAEVKLKVEEDRLATFTQSEEESLHNFLQNGEVVLILEKIHVTCPPPPSSSTLDNKSDSYHTVASELFSDAVQGEEGADVDATPLQETELRQSVASSHGSHSSSSERETGSTITVLAAMPDPSVPTPNPTTEETITRKVWFEYAEESLGRGAPGHGILKFFRHYPKVAHHVYYSVLIGRPIVICGGEDQRSKVSRIITALTPFVPPQEKIRCTRHHRTPSSSTWKLLRWHRGVLVSSHLSSFKLIGLCIPERLSVHDLIAARDQNGVTILNMAVKESPIVLLGPAYSGRFLAAFEPEVQIQRNFHNSDLAFLTYLGSILTEIQGKVYLLKSLEERDGKKKRSTLKDLNLKASDSEIVKHWGTLVSSADQVLQIF